MVMLNDSKNEVAEVEEQCVIEMYKVMQNKLSLVNVENYVNFFK